MMYPHKPIYVPSLKIPAHGARQQTGRSSDRHAKLSHQMSEATAEASERFLIRAVPLVYGVLIGSHVNHPLLGLLIGFMVTILLDLQFKDQSVIRPWLHAKPVILRRAGGHFLSHQ